jgi:carbamoylphosphate synthase small subunit
MTKLQREWAAIVSAAEHDSELSAILAAREILYRSGVDTKGLTNQARRCFRAAKQS